MFMHPVWGTFSALAAALVWGSADFSGGQASRRCSQYQALALSGISGGAVLLVLALLRGEAFPSSPDLSWALAAGLCGALGLGMLYRGLSMGNTALVAPVAAVVGALLPVIFDLLRREPPSREQYFGFGLALAGIWLVTQSGPALAHLRRSGLGLGLVAGISFGAFFILISRVNGNSQPNMVGSVFAPLFFARCATLGMALLVIRLRKEPLPPPGQHPLALLAGVLDAGGNIFYLLATYLTRLDVAAVLSSLYPAVTVLLAAGLVHEKMTRSQWVGLAACLAAVMLIVA